LPTAAGCKQQLARQSRYCVHGLKNEKQTILNVQKLKIMKPKKISLKEIKAVLSRDEMKKIMAGSGLTAYWCADKPFICHIWDPCWTCEGLFCYDWCGHA